MILNNIIFVNQYPPNMENILLNFNRCYWNSFDWNSFNGLTNDERKAKKVANVAGNTQEKYY